MAQVYDEAAASGSVAILTVNYGEAGAIDRYGPDLGLPSAFSGHNGYWYWGPPPESATSVVAVGFRQARLAPVENCTVEATIDNDAGVDNEERGARVWLCDSPSRPWEAVWGGFRRLG